ncbi:MAG TPA: sugar ABC transporter permease [Clostridiales bacterium]|nr:sugar ABC transporter permease [Clostridiales bacterium]
MDEIGEGRRLWTRFKKNFGLTAIALPGLIWFILFSYLPLIGIVIAFKDYRISGGFFESLLSSEWVGFENFKFMFATNDAKIMVRNTLLYNVFFIVINIAVPLFIAIMISELLNKQGAKAYQTMIFFPYFLSWVVVSYFVWAFLSPDRGLINRLLESLGMDGVSWYSEKKYWPFFLTFFNTWKNLGYNIVIYLATIVGIDRTYYEAASLDGASKWQQVKHITLPQLRSLVAVLFLMAIGKVFNSDFGLFYQVPRNSGALFPVTQTVDTYVYRTFRVIGDIGMSSAAAAFQSIVGLVFILVANYVIRKIDRESALF